MAQTFDPYRALGVRRDATDADVKAAHRRLAKRFHPDAAGGDHERFLRVQEAYRVLSDPLLRREWDAGHASGPIRADRAVPKREPRPTRESRARQEPLRPPERQPRPDDRAQAEPTETARRPRSTRAYTWSAADVPWWEEGNSENRRQPGRRRPARPPGPDEPNSPQPAANAEPAPEAPNAFDVYNRSSGAAWSMAARAYFRRGDQDLPRRGTFRYDGTQVLTGARARTAADAEARRRQAQHRHDAAVASPQASVTYDAHRIQQVRNSLRRRARAATWPSLRDRLLYALLAWVPVATVIGYGGSVAAGCDRASIGCPAYLETAQALAIAIVLGSLVALPKLAYLGAVSALGALLGGILLGLPVAIIASQSRLPVPPELLIVGALGIAYVATAAIVLARNPSTRPWSVAGSR